MITAEYLPGHLNVISDWESRNFQDKSEWKLLPTVFSRDLQEMGNPRNRSFCVKDFPPDSNLLCLETRPSKQSNDCTATEMGKHVSIRFPPFQSHRMGSEEIKERKCNSNLNNPNMADSAMVLNAVEYVSKQAPSYSSQDKIVDRSIWESSSFDTKSNPNFGGLEDFRKRLATEGISERASRLISRS